MSRIILVSNRLPVGISTGPDGRLIASRSNGGLATALSSLFDEQKSAWVGWTGLRRHLQPSELRQLDLPGNIIPINLSDQQITHFYDRYSNGVLWPLNHDVEPRITLDDTDIQSVHTVLKRFADAIMQVVKTDDTIWIHDYHLMLLPALLRSRGITNRIGFFLHTPFPSPTAMDSFPLLPETIRSLSSVDVLGVQVARDVHAAKQWGLSATAYPIGVDFERIDRIGGRSTTARAAQALSQKYAGKQIISSLSRLDYSKGIPTQLDAIELLARSRDDFVYRLNIAPSRESVLEYRDLHDAIVSRVHEINARYPLIDFTYENMDESEVTALLNATDIQLNIPIKDGMNLVAKEHIAARRTPATIVLSDAAGAADQLHHALLVPPNDPAITAATLSRALDMSGDEKARRWRLLRRNVKHENVQRWYESFMHDLHSPTPVNIDKNL